MKQLVTAQVTLGNNKALAVSPNRSRVHLLTAIIIVRILSRVSLTDPPNNLCPFWINHLGQRWQGRHRKRLTRHAVYQQPCVRRVFRQAGEVLGRHLSGVFAELFGQWLGVVVADLEGQD